MKVEARLTHAKIRHDQPCDTHLVLSLTAPPLADEVKRPSICLIAAIDVSPSMEGDKFAYAKRSALKLIDHLQPGDYFGLVDFAQHARLVLKPQKVTAEFKDQAKRAIGDLLLRGSTNIADALLVSLEAANKMDLGAEVLTRVILFTDGEANTGVAIRPNDILKLMEQNLGVATVSAFGYGEDVKQELLADMARIGKANYAFVKNPDDALSAFGKELGGLVSTWATDIVIDVSPLSGHEIQAVVSDVEAEEEVTGRLTIRIPDLLAEETRHVVISTKIEPQKGTGPRPVNLYDVCVHYDVLGADGRKERKSIETKAKAQFVKAGEEQKEPSKDVDQIVAQAQIVRAQIEAEKAASRGDFKAAEAVFQSTADSIQKRGLTDLGDVAKYVSNMYSDANSYRRTNGNRVGLRAAMTRAVGTSGLALEDESVLISANLNLSNSAQANMVQAFTQSDLVSPVGGATADTPPIGGFDASTSPIGGAAWPQSLGGQPNIMPVPTWVQGVGSAPSSQCPQKTDRKPIKQTKSSTRW